MTARKKAGTGEMPERLVGFNVENWLLGADTDELQILGPERYARRRCAEARKAWAKANDRPDLLIPIARSAVGHGNGRLDHVYPN